MSSVWQNAESIASFPQLQGVIEADVAIIGAGITGITTAILLQEAGLKVAVIESMQIGSGTSGFNSGHLTTVLLDMKYSTILKNFGKDKAKLAAQSQIEALATIKTLIKKFNIDCDFKTIPGILYATKEEQLSSLMEEFNAMQELNIDCSLIDKVPLPFKTLQGISCPNQARFHPLKYILSLAQQVGSKKDSIFENSHVISMEMKDICVVKTKEGEVRAKSVVMATYTPARTENPIEDCLFWDLDDPYHYTRVFEDQKGQLLIIGGEDHKTGLEKHPLDSYKNLESYARDHYNISSIDYQWSAQLYDPADGLPYIGKIPFRKNIYIAAGYSGEGLTGGTCAAKIISDQILERENSFAKLYNPRRIKPLASIKNFLSTTSTTLIGLILDRFKGSKDLFNEINKGEGKLVKHKGKQIAAYKDDKGEIHLISPVCTHLGCIVGWNEEAKSWDCPCHGGRYDSYGKVLNGPPTRGLQQIQ